MKRYIVLMLAFALVLSLCACGTGQSGQSAPAEEKRPDAALYIKDSEFFFTDLETESWQVTSRLVDDEDIKDEDLAYYGSTLAWYTHVSGDGSLVFFPDKVSDSDDGFNLYYRKTKEPEAEATKIDSDVTVYTVNSDATVVTYLKGTGEDRNLYQYTIKEDMKEKIAGEVRSYEISEDGSRILYINSEGNLYLKNGTEDKEKIASDITQVVYFSEDFSLMYYIKDEALYRQAADGDREKIDSDIYKVIRAYDSGEVYYLKREAEAGTLMDYVVDDMKAVDEAAPTEYPSRPYSYYYDTTEEYDKAYAEYQAAYEAYYAAGERNDWRMALTEQKLGHTAYSLYYYNGTEETLITETFAGSGEYAAAAEAPVICYVSYNQESFSKQKLSELVEANDFEGFQQKVEEALFSSSDRYIAIGSAAAVLDQENASAIRINEAGTEVYYVDDIPEGKDAGDLYRVAIVEGAAGAPELYDSDVYAGNAAFLSGGKFLYFKDYKEGSGDLYLNKTKVEYDVNGLYVNYNETADKLYFFADWDSEKEYGSLKEYSAGEVKKIADDVHDYSWLPDGTVLYLYDYSLKYYAGELYLWDNVESRKIDDDVIYLVPALSVENETKQQVQTMLDGFIQEYTAAPAETIAW